MSVENLLSDWKRNPLIKDDIAYSHDAPLREAQYSDFPDEIHPALVGALHSISIENLYSHQLASWRFIKNGKNVVISSGTASGKTLCYNLPIVDSLLQEIETTALYIFPTKALAQDQRNQMSILLERVQKQLNPASMQYVFPAIYDGDTSASARQAMRTNNRVLFTNPDMLHIGILPHHSGWNQFFRNLKFIVIDELHIYRGIFGAHVANVLRRLSRIMDFYGAKPQYILTSATTANPLEHATALCNRKFELISEDGSPHGKKHFLFINPPVIDPQLNIRRSALHETIALGGEILSHGLQCVAFTRARKTVEILLTEMRSTYPEFAALIHGYRSGYLPAERRAIEQQLKNNTAKFVCATNALELGVDIGGLDSVCMVGYPGSISSVRQQAGRAGRRMNSSLAILVATGSPLDQYLIRHPEFIFEKSPEHARIDPDNLLILLHHLQCAAFENPFREGEAFGNAPVELIHSLLNVLSESGVLYSSRNRFTYTSSQYPANEISLRSATTDTIVLQENFEGQKRQIIGTVDALSALSMVHPQAIYSHEGETYQVEHLDLDNKVAHLNHTQSDYYTQPIHQMTINIQENLKTEPVPAGKKGYSELVVNDQITGYKMIRWLSHEVIGTNELTLPANLLQTVGYWVAIDDTVVQRLSDEGLWKNNQNNYGRLWDEIRNCVRRRDSFTCQMCGAIESDRPHHVHHKIPFRNFQNPDEANRLENLVTLCPACHRRAESVVKMRSGLSGLRYLLHQLAPLFLMCDISDLGAHSDPVGIEGPMVMIYDQVPAGIGLSEELYSLHNELLQGALELVENCECQDGCPSCVGPPGELGSGGKLETLALLKQLVSPK